MASEVAEHGEGSGSGWRMPPKEMLKAVLLDLSKPIAQRMRSIFYLRTVGGDDAVEALCTALKNKEGTTLFRHELAYVLGQMQAKAAVPTLVSVLEDEEEDVVVRHESGEALGAIGDPSTLEVLDRRSHDAHPEVGETCQIAARRVRWSMEKGEGASADGHASDNPFASVDPAPAIKKPTKDEIPDFQRQLMDTSLPLFERYRAMFSLRNNRSKAAVLALCTGLRDASPLFRHEVAYVLGQLAHPASTTALQEAVADASEHEMVRHEAAEALGAIGTEEACDFLKKYESDPIVMLRESCQVALDIADYWSAEGKEGLGGEGATTGAVGDATGPGTA